jgi:hypothetical protein
MTASAGRPALAFALIGDVHCGAGLVARALNKVPGVVCHASFGRTPKERTAAHRRIYGEPPPRWWLEPVVNVEQYLREYCFERAPNKALAVGARLSYGLIEKHQLWEYLSSRLMEGGFCVIRVDRPPVDCMTSFTMHRNKKSRVLLDPDVVYKFVRRHLVVTQRAGTLFRDDCLSFPYRDLLERPHVTMRSVAEYLELPPASVPAGAFSAPETAFTPGSIRKRLANFSSVAAMAPDELREAIVSHGV